MNIHHTVFIAPGAIVLGDVTIGEDCSIWYHSTVRGDSAPIRIGRGSNIQDNCVVHVRAEYPVSIGENVSVGHGAILHGCTIEDNSLIGMGAILMDGCRIGKNCIIGAGTLITKNTCIPDNCLVLGNPGKIKREVTEEEATSILENAIHYVKRAKAYLTGTISSQ